MTTAERLEAITDRGLFEALATAVLRESDPDCAALIHTGLNASMETIGATIDGFVRVPGRSPARYIFVAHTTTGPPRLKLKWLSEQGNEADHGDFIKAARLASILQMQESDAEFRIILTTNHRISESLARDLDQAASRLNVGYEVWDQHRLAHFLDIHPEGQWIRRKYLGVTAERVSRSLLHTLAAQNIAEYRRSLSSDPDRWIERHTAGDVSTHSITGDVNLRLLLADSGLGKSTAASALLQNAHQGGHLALWLPAEDIASSTTIPEALGKTLLRLEPALQADAGRTALALETDRRVVLVVDDINRHPSPESLLRKLLAWTRPAAKSEKEGSGNIPFIVCPVWTAVWASIRSGFERQSWLQVSPIGLMDASEARTALSSSRITVNAAMLDELAQTLGNDPFLIGLFGEIAVGAPVEQLEALAQDALSAFLEQVIRQDPGEFLPEELDAALVQFAEWSLRQRQLYPRWEDVQQWIASDPVSGPRIRRILRNGILARVDGLQAGDRVVFRHDRIRDHLLERAIARALADSRGGDIVADPHYAELVAGAFALHPNRSSLSQMETDAPFAVIALLRHLHRMDPSVVEWVRPRIAQWADRFFTSKTITKGVRATTTELLLDANDPTAILIADRLGSGEWLDLVRLRNGDLQAGIRACKPDRVMGFAPSVRHPTRDRAIQIAFSRFGDRMHHELAAFLSDPGIADEEREGALALAGLACLSGLDAEIARCWENAADQTRLLADTIWAVARCCGENAPAALDPLLDAWGQLSEEIGEGGSSPRLHIATALSTAFQYGLPEAVLRYLAQEMVIRTPLERYLVRTLQRVDDPIAIESVVRSAANHRRRAKESGGFSPLASSISDTWDLSIHGAHLSKVSRAHLQFMWSNPDENHWVRIQALHMWVRAEGNPRLDLLRGIRQDEPHHGDALWFRAAAGDPMVVPEILNKLESEPHWLHFAGKLWSLEVSRITEEWLAKASREACAAPLHSFPDLHFDLTRILADISPNDAEPLLEAHWHGLRRFPLFIQAALFIGTPRMRQLAAGAIGETDQKEAIFEYVHHTFGVMETPRLERLTLEHFKSLQPYFQFIKQQPLEQIARQCARMGLREWAAEHVRPYLPPEIRLRAPLTQEDLTNQLDAWLSRVQSHRSWELEMWIDKSAEATEGQRRALDAAMAYYNREPGRDRFEVLGEVIAALGTRQDLSLLKQLLPPGDDLDAYFQDIALRVRRRSLT